VKTVGSQQVDVTQWTRVRLPGERSLSFPIAMLRPIAILLTILTGFTGLVYEVTWQKYVATLLGSHSEATASILGIFLAGLSLG
jgi:hypothetical protein